MNCTLPATVASPKSKDVVSTSTVTVSTTVVVTVAPGTGTSTVSVFVSEQPTISNAAIQIDGRAKWLLFFMPSLNAANISTPKIFVGTVVIDQQ